MAALIQIRMADYAATGLPPAYLPKDEIVQHIKKIISTGDLVITLGAGDILMVSDALAEELK